MATSTEAEIHPHHIKEFDDRIVIPMPKDMKEKLQHNCYMERTNMSKVVRKLVENYNKRIDKKLLE